MSQLEFKAFLDKACKAVRESIKHGDYDKDRFCDHINWIYSKAKPEDYEPLASEISRILIVGWGLPYIPIKEGQ